MPFLAPAIPPQVAEVRPFRESDEPLAQGLEGEQIREQIDKVTAHWKLQTASATEQDFIDEHSYRHVSLENAGMRRVRYVRTEDLTPRKIVFDGEPE